MTPSIDTPSQRRTVLKLLGAAAGAGTLGSAAHASASSHDGDRSFVVEQGDTCIEVVPLSGEEPVEEFYDYRYPTAEYDSVSGSNGYSYSSGGTTDHQEDGTSVLYLYDGPEGLSLVVVHGRLEGDDEGGTVTFDFAGMPEDVSWVVRDDYYLVEGEPAETNYDRWDVDGSDQQVDWAYRGGRTDGGAARGLGEEFEFSIDPAFNDDAALASDHPSYGPVESWEVLTWDGESPERVSLQLDEPVTIRSGTCDGPSDGGSDDQNGGDDVDGDPDDQDGGKDKDNEKGKNDEPDDQDGESDDDGDSEEDC